MEKPSWPILLLPLSLASFALAACQPGAGNPERVANFDAIAPGETIRFGGNEPFWGGDVTGESLTYTTPDNIDGAVIVVERFAGNNGLGFSGMLDGRSFDMTITLGDCDDTMSDRTYPYAVTLMIGDEQRHGCAWTDRQPFTGPENP